MRAAWIGKARLQLAFAALCAVGAVAIWIIAERELYRFHRAMLQQLQANLAGETIEVLRSHAALGRHIASLTEYAGTGTRLVPLLEEIARSTPMIHDIVVSDETGHTLAEIHHVDQGRMTDAVAGGETLPPLTAVTIDFTDRSERPILMRSSETSASAALVGVAVAFQYSELRLPGRITILSLGADMPSARPGAWHSWLVGQDDVVVAEAGWAASAAASGPAGSGAETLLKQTASTPAGPDWRRLRALSRPSGAVRIVLADGRHEMLYQRLDPWPVTLVVDTDQPALPRPGPADVLAALLCLLSAFFLWRGLRKNGGEAATGGVTPLPPRQTALTQDLAAGLAHKFNNLLTVLAFDAEMLATSDGDDEATQVLARSMLGATAQGTLMTQSLLAFAERAVLSPVTVDLEAELTRRHDRLLAALDPGQVLLRSGPSSAGPRLLLKVDPDALEACLVALLRNAADAAGERAEITLELERIAAPGVQQVELVVDDAGPGMDAATLALAMEPGFSRRTNGRHLGLGLAAANGFARQSGGTLTLESMPGMGTRARLVLPLLPGAPQTGEPAGPAVPEPRSLARSPARPRRVLLVEDSVPVRDSIARRLRADGYDVVDAVTVSEVLAHVARGVDVMVTDIVLSDAVDGWTLATRARELNPMLPLVFMSGFMTSRQPELLSGNELASFVRKPVNGAELNTVIAGLLALRETRQLQSDQLQSELSRK